MSQKFHSAPNAQSQNTMLPAAPGERQKGLVGAISANQVTNVQVGTSGSGTSVQPATSDNAGKK